MTGPVNKQPHYTQFKIQPIDFIRANIDTLDALQANVIKYVCRYKLKGGRRDLEKAADYLRMMIEDLKGYDYWDSAQCQSHPKDRPPTQTESESNVPESWKTVGGVLPEPPVAKEERWTLMRVREGRREFFAGADPDYITYDVHPGHFWFASLREGLKMRERFFPRLESFSVVPESVARAK